MASVVSLFKDLKKEYWAEAGGKGGTLARLYQQGYPVPDGFVILPEAFQDEELQEDAWQQIALQLSMLRNKYPELSFAVRSSAVAEDSAYASFAGEFETVLDVRTNPAVREAIRKVHQSRGSDRVRSYSKAKGIEGDQPLSVVVQRLIRAEISGILFTADPVTSSRLQMTGNYVYGFGEELVSGEAEPFTFSFKNPRGTYQGPPELKRYARKLFRLASKLEKELGSPQDIEWALADGKVYILQSRPITTLEGYDPVRGEWNSSFTGDYAWVSSEVFHDTLTPASWSVWKNFQQVEGMFGIKGIGNIAGHFYMNMSFAGGMLKMVGKDEEFLVDYTKLTTGFDLSTVTIPPLHIKGLRLFLKFLPVMVKMLPEQSRLMKRHDEILAQNLPWAERMLDTIPGIHDPRKLAALWNEELWKSFWNILQLQDKANEDYFGPYLAARERLIKLIGKENAESLLSNLVGQSGDLTSLGQLLGLQQLVEGQITRSDYRQIAGHRCASENELSHPRRAENPDWIDQGLEDYKRNPIDYRQMLLDKQQDFEEVWQQFADRYPRKSARIRSLLDKTSAALEKRERIRSELTRTLRVFRAWFLQAGELTGIGEDIFHLQFEEVQELLGGDQSWRDLVPIRKSAHQRHLELPPLPLLISGRFDPYTWAESPNRRSDYYDAHVAMTPMEMSDLIKGLPGSAGQVEGLVKIIRDPDQSRDFNQGEILVAASTNVGWTPLFPKAAAVITDIGAPLSHAAIVARELGIPAVVGTGNGTLILHTGDRVRVDGSHGLVEIIERAG